MTYGVTYQANAANSGTVPLDALSPYNAGATVTVLGNSGTLAESGGFTFAGWNTQANGLGVGYAPGATFTINAATILYAVFTSNAPPSTPAAPLSTPTVTINDIPSSAIYGGSFTPTYHTSGDGQVFSVTSSTTSVCAVSSDGTTVNYVGVGTCTLTASVAATTTYTAATGSPQSFLVAPATPTVTITNMLISFPVGGSFTPTYHTSGDGQVFSATSSTLSVCTVSGLTVHFVSAGTCSLIATVEATTDYTTASSTATTLSSSAAKIPPVKIPPEKIPSSAPLTGAGGMARFTDAGGLLIGGGLLVFAGLAAMAFALRRRRLWSHPKL